MPSALTKFFTHNCPNVEALLAFKNLSNGFLLRATDQNKAPVLFRGSLSLFSGFALRAGVQKSGSSISFSKSGNEPFMVEHERLGYISLSLSRQIPL
ncbi:hypothetical protein Nepgr_025985 [Nepenthes gracilis]|uniref:Uncharacterized protein n=1 Tax=Nepenthes gracilis TaxID=150966 RepID=A0AAD3T7G2_NEPGR|nr:hypothetical protein Nepgr_025985 [Nepenthes gracilis]